MDVIYFLPELGIRKGAKGLWHSGLGLHQLGIIVGCKKAVRVTPTGLKPKGKGVKSERSGALKPDKQACHELQNQDGCLNRPAKRDSK